VPAASAVGERNPVIPPAPTPPSVSALMIARVGVPLSGTLDGSTARPASDS
jgi:hypothetical protein